MKVFTHNKFEGHWPVGTSAVIVAESREQALELLRLNPRLPSQSKPLKLDDFITLDITKENCRILNDGEY